MARWRLPGLHQQRACEIGPTPAAAWDARLIGGTRSFIGFEGAYVGAARSIQTLGAHGQQPGRSSSNGVEGNLRINVPIVEGALAVRAVRLRGGWLGPLQHLELQLATPGVLGLHVDRRRDDRADRRVGSRTGTRPSSSTCAGTTRRPTTTTCSRPRTAPAPSIAGASAARSGSCSRRRPRVTTGPRLASARGAPRVRSTHVRTAARSGKGERESGRLMSTRRRDRRTRATRARARRRSPARRRRAGRRPSRCWWAGRACRRAGGSSAQPLSTTVWTIAGGSDMCRLPSLGRVQVGELARDHEAGVGRLRARRQMKGARPRHRHVARPDHHARQVPRPARTPSPAARAARSDRAACAGSSASCAAAGRRASCRGRPA